MIPQATKLAVVDDDPQVRISLQRLLAPEGFEVMTFGSGRALLETLEGRLPDCLIMDIHMPGPNGFETVAILREQGLDPRVIFISGDDVEQLVRQYPGTRSKILSKPFNSANLLSALRHALQPNQETDEVHP